jgi:branched-chain amino acid transport system ATP-binding protein
MTLYKNLEMGTSSKRARPKFKQNLEMVYEMFPRLKERAGQKAETLSSGEQQMVAVGRGIMADPRILMIDELSLGPAPVLVLQLFESLRKLRENGITIPLVEQNVQLALAVSDYGYVLSEGRTELEGQAHDVIHNEHVRTAYLGI